MKVIKRIKKLNKLFTITTVEIWVFIERFFQKIGVEKYSDTVYFLFYKKSKKFYKLYNFFLAAFYRKYYSFFKVEDNLVFLDCFWGRKVGDHPYAIYREILKDNSKKWKFIWVKNAGVIAPKDVVENPNVKFVEHRSVAYAVGLLKAGVLVCNSNFLPFFARRNEQVFINTWHGIPLKKLGLDTPQPLLASLNTQRNFNQATVIPMSSKWTAEKVVGSYGSGLAMERVVETGSPRIDLILNADAEEVRDRLKIPSDKKVILYAPTWRGAIGSVSKNISEQIEAIKTIKYTTAKEYVLYVSLHHLTRRALGKLPEGISYVPDDIDICEFLAAVDVLVSDYSSIFIDYLVLDRPVILHVHDLEVYQEKRGLLLNIEELPVSLTYKNSDLIEIFQKIKNPSSFSNYNEYKTMWLPHEDGEAAKRCWEKSKNKQLVNSKDKRKNILIYGGMLANNGITQSLMNLMRAADKEQYRFSIGFSASLGRPNSASAINLARIQEYAEVILLPNQARMLMSEYLAAGVSKNDEISNFNIFKNSLEKYSDYEVRRHLTTFKFDIYIDFTGYSYFWSLLAPCIHADKRIVYLHSDMYEEWKNKDRKMSRLGGVINNYKNYDYLVSVSQAVHEQNNKKLEKYITGKTKSVAVPNSFDGNRVIDLADQDLSEISASTVAYLKYNKESNIFITISRLSPEKNLAMLVEAFYEVKKSRQDTLLIIVGAGSERSKLRLLVDRLGLLESVHFAGFMENPYPLLKAADCLVFPSMYEGQGLVLLEALTLGKYCIATDMPASREILEGGYGGLIEPTVDGFSQALLSYCDKKPTARSFNHEVYSKNAINKFDELLNGLLN